MVSQNHWQDTRLPRGAARRRGEAGGPPRAPQAPKLGNWQELGTFSQKPWGAGRSTQRAVFALPLPPTPRPSPPRTGWGGGGLPVSPTPGSGPSLGLRPWLALTWVVRTLHGFSQPSRRPSRGRTCYFHRAPQEMLVGRMNEGMSVAGLSCPPLRPSLEGWAVRGSHGLSFWGLRGTSPWCGNRGPPRNPRKTWAWFSGGPSWGLQPWLERAARPGRVC